MQRKSLVFVLAPGAFLLMGQAKELLDRAFLQLKARNYQSAKNTAQTYLNRYPRTYKAEFIRAASNCSLYPGSQLAIRQMSALKYDYPLGATQLANVNVWLNKWCQPRVQARAEDNCNSGECSISSGLGRSPPASDITSATAPEPSPAPLPSMSALQYSVSFSGDDYRHYNNVASPASCAQICRVQTACRSMTYITSARVCWLKRSKPPAQSGSDFTSAYKILPP